MHVRAARYCVWRNGWLTDEHRTSLTDFNYCGGLAAVWQDPLLLLILVLLSALAVVLSTHRTRLLIVEREHLMLERDALDIEWRNLILEENALGDHSRVERIATEKLQMQRVSPAQEKWLNNNGETDPNVEK